MGAITRVFDGTNGVAAPMDKNGKIDGVTMPKGDFSNMDPAMKAQYQHLILQHSSSGGAANVTDPYTKPPPLQQDLTDSLLKSQLYAKDNKDMGSRKGTFLTGGLTPGNSAAQSSGSSTGKTLLGQ